MAGPSPHRVHSEHATIGYEHAHSQRQIRVFSGTGWARDETEVVQTLDLLSRLRSWQQTAAC